MKGVIEFMLMATQDEDEHVALEACEFWSAYCETKVCSFPPVCCFADSVACWFLSKRTLKFSKAISSR